jgi:hypothetical protein
MKWCAGVAVRAAVQDLRVFTTACSTLVSYTTYVLVLVLGLFAHSYNSLPGFPFPSKLPLALAGAGFSFTHSTISTL